ncbi:hypothetical protein RDV64_20745 [Acuticoccus sp. MNP-M23]|uniref:hypothetical protein n=1 Tax=Acuticoccus sp. MNP-M23 TaxID=3072793 RepID=UPI0028159F9B|nr:hypothetical protein [Acuticoccus sp. MNP-M23]WMS42463.1 hypothetical protein RDV64_20745 [Acuticoccus sp. MNP-M23]
MARIAYCFIALIFGGFLLATASESLAQNAKGLAPFVPPPAKEGFAYPDCYCTDTRGRRVEMGERVCLSVSGRNRLARCGMSQNTPVWRFERESCPLS